VHFMRSKLDVAAVHLPAIFEHKDHPVGLLTSYSALRPRPILQLSAISPTLGLSQAAPRCCSENSTGRIRKRTPVKRCRLGLPGYLKLTSFERYPPAFRNFLLGVYIVRIYDHSLRGHTQLTTVMPCRFRLRMSCTRLQRSIASARLQKPCTLS
jgi:hypothetical protein